MSGEAKDFFIFGVSVKDIVPVVIGAIVGGIIGFGSSLGISWFNNRTRRKKEEKEKAIDIIKEVVKFVQKADDIASDMKSYSKLTFKGKLKGERKKQKWIDTEEKLDSLYPEWAFIEFQLLALGNQDIMDKFKAFMNAHATYFDVLMPDKFKPGIEKSPEEEYLRLYTQFIKRCVEFCRVLTPVRTPGAPTKKKGLAKKG